MTYFLGGSSVEHEMWPIHLYFCEIQLKLK